MNRDYTNIYKHRIPTWSEDLYGLAFEGMTYSQISMGAGEQRVIKILASVFDAPEHAIILIDEIDLLLHEDAFQRIIEVLCLRADKKNLQIVFTTHRESVLKKSDKINIRYLYKSNGSTRALEQVTADAIAKLTGTLDKSIILYIEDGLSSRVMKKICQTLKISRHIKTVEFGAAKNCFAVTAGSVVSNPEKHILSIIDGDIYSSDDEKIAELNKVITGTSPESRRHKEQALSAIFQYAIPEGLSPEQYIKESIARLERDALPEHHREIYDALSNIHAVLNKHNYINSIMNFYDESPEIIIKDVIDLFSTTPEWMTFTQEVTEALVRKAEVLQLNENAEDVV